MNEIWSTIWQRKKIQLPWRVIVTALSCILIGELSAADSIRINVHQSDEAVRQRLLELTPLGTPTEQVFRFAESRLHREGPVVGWPPKYPRARFGNFFSAWLGHYYEAKNVFMFPTVVQAFW